MLLLWPLAPSGCGNQASIVARNPAFEQPTSFGQALGPPPHMERSFGWDQGHPALLLALLMDFLLMDCEANRIY